MDDQVDEVDRAAAALALESSSSEYSEIDSLLIKLATGGLGFSVALGAFEAKNQTGWLVASWYALIACVVVVLASKYLSTEANRAFYLAKKHKDAEVRKKKKALEERLDRWVARTNYTGCALFLLGAAFTVLHVVAVGR